MNIALPTKGWKFFVGFVHGFPMLSWPLDDCMLSSSDLLACEGDKMKKMPMATILTSQFSYCGMEQYSV